MSEDLSYHLARDADQVAGHLHIHLYVCARLSIRRPLGVAKACERFISCYLPLLILPTQRFKEGKGGGEPTSRLLNLDSARDILQKWPLGRLPDPKPNHWVSKMLLSRSRRAQNGSKVAPRELQEGSKIVPNPSRALSKACKKSLKRPWCIKSRWKTLKMLLWKLKGVGGLA